MTSYKDAVNAIGRLIREAKTLDEAGLGAPNHPGYPLIRPHEVEDYLRRLAKWVDISTILPKPKRDT